MVYASFQWVILFLPFRLAMARTFSYQFVQRHSTIDAVYGLVLLTPITICSVIVAWLGRNPPVSKPRRPLGSSYSYSEHFEYPRCARACARPRVDMMMRQTSQNDEYFLWSFAEAKRC